MIINEAISKNNAAVALIETGNYKEATVHLSSVLRGLRDDIMMCNLDDVQRNFPRTTSLDQCMVESQGPGRFEENTGDDPCIYDAPIRMPLSLEKSCGCSNVIASILLFNLALAHHLLLHSSSSDESTTKNSSSILDMILLLYERAFDMQASQDVYFDQNYYFVLACVNNIAVVHRQRDQSLLSKQCFEKVLSILMFLTDNGIVNDGGRLDMSIFYHNVTITGGCCQGAVHAASA